MELIFIGDEFYRKSGTMMSSLYTTEGRRSDWGFVNIALKRGEAVNIRPATEDEIKHYEKVLEAYNEQMERSERWG